MRDGGGGRVEPVREHELGPAQPSYPARMNRKDRAKQTKKNERAKKIAARQERERAERRTAELAELERPPEGEEAVAAEGSAVVDPDADRPCDEERTLLDMQFEFERLVALGTSEPDVAALLSKYDEARLAEVRAARLLRVADQAGELAFQALDEPRVAKRIELARAALALDPACVDALIVVAQHENDSNALRKLAEAARAELGSRHKGEDAWWEMPQRPYLRALAAWRDALDREGSSRAARAIDEELFARSPSDGIHARWRIVKRLFDAGELAEGADEIEALFEAGFEGDPVLLAFAALERALAQDWAPARDDLLDAAEELPELVAFLGSEAVPDSIPTDPHEVAADLVAQVWNKHRRELDWALDVLLPTK